MGRSWLEFLQAIQEFFGLWTFFVILVHSEIVNETLTVDDGCGGVRHFSRLLIKNTPRLSRLIVWIVKDRKFEFEILAEFGQGFQFIG